MTAHIEEHHMNIQAELISIGNELLNGRTLNTHGRDLGNALSAIGLRLMRDTTIPDDIGTIGDTIDEALGRVGLVFISGGLGPTVDDITRDAIAKLLNQKTVIHQPTVETMTERYTARGRKMTLAATRQALILETAVALPNSVGAAPGQRITPYAGKTLFVLPGPPTEFNAILNEEIVPWLKKEYSGARPLFVRLIHTKGIGESDIVTILEEAAFQPEGVELGFYAAMGKVEIRLTARPELKVQVAEAEQTLRRLLTDFIDHA
jgi:nicotinamide-nucleotide amidase